MTDDTEEDIEKARLKLIKQYDDVTLSNNTNIWKTLHSPGHEGFYQLIKFVQAMRLNMVELMRHRAIVLQPTLFKEADSLLAEIDYLYNVVQDMHKKG